MRGSGETADNLSSADGISQTSVRNRRYPPGLCPENSFVTESQAHYTFMIVDTEIIPEALTSRKQWVSWRTEDRKGKSTKVPINPRTGGRASCTDETTWGTFEEAMRRFEKDNLGGVG